MPDQLKVHPGERVDLVDYVHGANTYTLETQKFQYEREWLDRRSRVLDGFRVRVEDQTANPGMVTVYNGNALDRSGQFVNNEQVINDSRSITLLGSNLNFYVEIEVIFNESGVDSRYHWDPTIPNTPPEPNGSEFSLNVATRLTPDWRIVSPVSTTGFEQDTNPNSVRIPIGVFRTDGSNRVVVGGTNPGLVLVRPASVLEVDAAIGDSSIRVVDVRLFPATTPFNFTLDFGGTSPEALTVSSIDRANGILNLSGALASNHSAGAIVRVTSGLADVVRENTDPSDPALDPTLATPGHPDAAQRLWQANEVRGSGLMQSKETFGVRDDLNIRSLKDHIDNLAAQVRELKFGHPRPEVVSTAPPATFATRPRWFDRAGSVAGARSNTVSIGNGTTSFGDFNGTNGSTLVTAAVAALPASGGTIFVKAGTYLFPTTVTISKNVVFVGESSATTVFESTNAGGAGISLTGNVRFESMTIQRNVAAAVAILDLAAAINVSFEFCNFTGQIRLVGVNAGILAKDTTFTSSGSSTMISGSTLGATLTNSYFLNCTIAANGLFSVASMNNVQFTGSNITAAALIAVVGAGAQPLTNVVVERCSFTGASVVITSNTNTGAVSGFLVRDCAITSTFLDSDLSVFAFANTGVIDRVHISDNFINVTSGTQTAANPAFVLSLSSTLTSDDLVFSGNQVDCFVGSFVVGCSIDQTTLSSLCKIENNHFFAVKEMVRLGGAVGNLSSGDVLIAGNQHNNFNQHEDVYGVRLMNNKRLTTLMIRDNTFSAYAKATGGTRRACIDVSTTNVNPMTVHVTGNKGQLIGVATFAGDAYGFVYDANTGSAVPHAFNVDNNDFESIMGSDGQAGVYIRNSGASNEISARIHNNRISKIGVDGIDGFACGILVANVGNSGFGPSVQITENTIYEVITSDGSQPGSGIEINSCNAVIISQNNVTACTGLANTDAAQQLGACVRIYSTANQTGLVISDNTLKQDTAADPSLSQYTILVYCDGVLTNYQISGNSCLGSSQGGPGVYLSSSGSFVNGVISGNNVVWNTTNNNVAGIQCEIGGASKNLVISNNTVQETTYSAQMITHRGIYVLGDEVGGTATGISVIGNTLIGVKAGALLTNANRVGIYMRGALARTLVQGNIVDWNEPGVLEGIGIRYIDNIGSGGPWSGHLCVGNFVRGDNSATAGGEVDITTANYTNGFLDSNQLGETGAVGTIVPGVAAGGWTYGTNKLS